MDKKDGEGKENPAVAKIAENLFQIKEMNINTDLITALTILLSSLVSFLYPCFPSRKGGSGLERGCRRCGNGGGSQVTDRLRHHAKREQLEKRAGWLHTARVSGK